MIEAITFSQDKKHLLVIKKNDVDQDSPVYSLEAIPLLVPNQKIIFDLDYENQSLKDEIRVSEKKEGDNNGMERIQQQPLNQIEDINFEFSEPSSQFIVIIDLESAYQDNAISKKYRLNTSISNIFGESGIFKSIVLSTVIDNPLEPQLTIDLIRDVEVEV